MPKSDWLGAIYQRFRQELFITAWTILRRADLAEDAVHSAFIRLMRREFPPIDPKPYVFRSVRNAAIDLAKSRSRRREEPLLPDWDQTELESASPDDDMSRSLSDVLERLDDPSREVIELHLQASLTFQEISQMLSEPLPTVASRYRRALDKLRAEMKVRHE
ncbi:MAG TPA: sigma-70 family RNA polymerase sigma factor [Pirellulales bacterium]|jgi:RNA polymerase sigma-70 factor (ECF subfamily)|nr:sigma-70 family RNA polymerase sigma factor [Pirellulales bacterium]